jgi:16S rRNA (guanine527-N7)-methyltransferase
MSDAMFAIIAQGASELDIDLPPETGAAFRVYYDFLEKHGQNVNLTAITGIENIARLHFLDSLALLGLTSFKNKRVLDIGSGAGFPGVPLKIAEPSIDLTLLDATGKKISFLSELCAKIDIKSMFINARAEDAAYRSDLREQYDIVVSRAVARLNVLSELCLPFVRVEGLMIAMKGETSTEEVKEARNSISTLGAVLQDSVDYTIPGTDIIHRAVIYRKAANTPDKYPRRFAKIQKRPL